MRTSKRYSRRSPEYREYINSDVWKERVRRLKRERGNRCEHCKVCGVVIQGHHERYAEVLGTESDEDILLLCRSCHRIADRKRRKRVRLKRANARLNGWATRAYGRDWVKLGKGRVEREFKAWLRLKGRKW